MPRKDKRPKQPKAMKVKSAQKSNAIPKAMKSSLPKPKAIIQVLPKRKPIRPRQALEATQSGSQSVSVTESVQPPRKVAKKKPKELRPEVEPAWYSEGLQGLRRKAAHPRWAEHFAEVLGHEVWQALKGKCPADGLRINVASYTND